MRNIEWREYPGPDVLVRDLADRICDLLASSIRERGAAGFAVSGGSTPVPLFVELSRRQLEWERVVVTLVDERWVEPSHPDSNERLIRTHLLQEQAARARLVGMKTGHDDARAGEAACEERLRQVPRPFAALVLGMGNDGHTASLFPGADRLAEATAMDSGRLCIALVPPRAPHARMTLTLPAILDCRQIVLLITGREKRRVYEQALAGGPPEEMPIRFILGQERTPVMVCWAAAADEGPGGG